MRLEFSIMERKEQEKDNIMTAIGALMKEESRLMASKDPIEMEWADKVRNMRMMIMETTGAHARRR